MGLRDVRRGTGLGTYSCVAAGVEDLNATFGCQGLGAGDDALGAVHNASPAAKLGEYGPPRREDVFRWEGHF